MNKLKLLTTVSFLSLGLMATSSNAFAELTALTATEQALYTIDNDGNIRHTKDGTLLTPEELAMYTIDSNGIIRRIVGVMPTQSGTTATLTPDEIASYTQDNDGSRDAYGQDQTSKSKEAMAHAIALATLKDPTRPDFDADGNAKSPAPFVSSSRIASPRVASTSMNHYTFPEEQEETDGRDEEHHSRSRRFVNPVYHPTDKGTVSTVSYTTPMTNINPITPQVPQNKAPTTQQLSAHDALLLQQIADLQKQIAQLKKSQLPDIPLTNINKINPSASTTSGKKFNRHERAKFDSKNVIDPHKQATHQTAIDTANDKARVLAMQEQDNALKKFNAGYAHAKHQAQAHTGSKSARAQNSKDNQQSATLAQIQYAIQHSAQQRASQVANLNKVIQTLVAQQKQAKQELVRQEHAQAKQHQQDLHQQQVTNNKLGGIQSSIKQTQQQNAIRNQQRANDIAQLQALVQSLQNQPATQQLQEQKSASKNIFNSKDKSQASKDLKHQQALDAIKSANHQKNPYTHTQVPLNSGKLAKVQATKNNQGVTNLQLNAQIAQLQANLQALQNQPATQQLEAQKNALKGASNSQSKSQFSKDQRHQQALDALKSANHQKNPYTHTQVPLNAGKLAKAQATTNNQGVTPLQLNAQIAQLQANLQALQNQPATQQLEAQKNALKGTTNPQSKSQFSKGQTHQQALDALKSANHQKNPYTHTQVPLNSGKLAKVQATTNNQGVTPLQLNAQIQTLQQVIQNLHQDQIRQQHAQKDQHAEDVHKLAVTNHQLADMQNLLTSLQGQQTTQAQTQALQQKHGLKNIDPLAHQKQTAHQQTLDKQAQKALSQQQHAQDLAKQQKADQLQQQHLQAKHPQLTAKDQGHHLGNAKVAKQQAVGSHVMAGMLQNLQTQIAGNPHAQQKHAQKTINPHSSQKQTTHDKTLDQPAQKALSQQQHAQDLAKQQKADKLQQQAIQQLQQQTMAKMQAQKQAHGKSAKQQNVGSHQTATQLANLQHQQKLTAQQTATQLANLQQQIADLSKQLKSNPHTTTASTAPTSSGATTTTGKAPTPSGATTTTGKAPTPSGTATPTGKAPTPSGTATPTGKAPTPSGTATPTGKAPTPSGTGTAATTTPTTAPTTPLTPRQKIAQLAADARQAQQQAVLAKAKAHQTAVASQKAKQQAVATQHQQQQQAVALAHQQQQQQIAAQNHQQQLANQAQAQQHHTQQLANQAKAQQLQTQRQAQTAKAQQQQTQHNAQVVAAAKHQQQQQTAAQRNQAAQAATAAQNHRERLIEKAAQHQIRHATYLANNMNAAAAKLLAAAQAKAYARTHPGATTSPASPPPPPPPVTSPASPPPSSTYNNNQAPFSAYAQQEKLEAHKQYLAKLSVLVRTARVRTKFKATHKNFDEHATAHVYSATPIHHATYSQNDPQHNSGSGSSSHQHNRYSGSGSGKYKSFGVHSSVHSKKSSSTTHSTTSSSHSSHKSKSSQSSSSSSTSHKKSKR